MIKSVMKLCIWIKNKKKKQTDTRLASFSLIPAGAQWSYIKLMLISVLGGVLCLTGLVQIRLYSFPDVQ